MLSRRQVQIHIQLRGICKACARKVIGGRKPTLNERKQDEKTLYNAKIAMHPQVAF